jgi:hypothetical protein
VSRRREIALGVESALPRRFEPFAARLRAPLARRLIAAAARLLRSLARRNGT